MAGVVMHFNGNFSRGPKVSLPRKPEPIVVGVEPASQE
jgi:hypothetical protein